MVESAFSLPLMGIGNSSRAPRCRAPIPSHYPSWGSETPVERRSMRVRVLITPHGDRKLHRSPSSAWRGGETSHYPSWGSETSVAIGVRCESPCSLPLMGIGNSGSAGTAATPRSTTTAHYPSWGSETCNFGGAVGGPDVSLPLMGIGNLPLLEGHRIGLRPHYPSWGSETSRRCARCAARSGTHYPSWGSETTTPTMLSRHSRRRSTPHYPSWGSETPILTGSDGSSVPFGDDHARSRYGKRTRGPRFVRLSPGAEGVLCSGARCAVHTTDQFFPCQPSSC